MDLKKYLNYLVDWIKEKVDTAKSDGVIFGLSGGIDSAVVSILGKKAFPNNFLSVWMPCDSSELDFECVEEHNKKFDLNTITLDLSDTFNILSKELINSNIKITDLSLSNTKSRLRMTTLYALGQSKNYLVLGTDNLVESYIGYFTKYGDGGVDLLPIAHLLKREVIEAAKILDIPEKIIKRKPTASLWPDQTDESEIGFSYSEIDEYISSGTGSVELKNKIDTLHLSSKHKRKLPPKPEVEFTKKYLTIDK